jgi:hypothetical protein
MADLQLPLDKLQAQCEKLLKERGQLSMRKLAILDDDDSLEDPEMLQGQM